MDRVESFLRKRAILKGSLSDGYLKFSVRTDFSTSFAVRIHKFQAYNKYGKKIFDEGVVVRHKNGIKTDNSRTNILIGTQSQNMRDRSKADLVKHAKTKRVIPVEVGEQIMKDREEGVSYRKLVEKYGMPKSTLMDYVNRMSKE